MITAAPGIHCRGLFVFGGWQAPRVPYDAPMLHYLDPDLQTVLEAVYAQQLFDWDGLDAAAVRAKFLAIKTMPQLPDIPRVEDVSVPGTGGPVPCRFYHPRPGARVPLLVWCHGGGWVLGGLDQEEATCRRLALQGDMAVLSVDYRLAPEHRFPCAFYDTVAAWRWAHTNAEALGCLPQGCGIGGGSAGGNLAAATTQMMVVDGGPVPAHQLLVYPIVDADLNRASMHAHAQGPVLHRAHMEWFWSQYVPAPANRSDWRAAPLRAPTFVGLPQTTIELAGVDPLIDEGLAYAKALEDAGVEVHCTVYEGLTHGYQGMAANVPAAEAIVRAMARRIGACLREASAGADQEQPELAG